MKKLLLIKNPELFQGEKYLSKNKNYFEGWYFKNTNHKNVISFIPGININRKEKKAFIQIITIDSSYYVNYNFDDFSFHFNPFYIKIGDNYFSKDRIHIDIKDISQNLTIYGDIKYRNNMNIKSNWYSPNIMGPFSYISSMECNHAILSMKSKTDGFITINNKDINFDNGVGYIEKDWGCSFPKTYIWHQANEFQKKKAAFMISIANIPFKFFHFRGLICSLIVKNKEYRFATYNNTKIKRYEVNDNLINITLKKGKYYLFIESKSNQGYKLAAPVKGKMNKDITESISSIVTVILKKGNKTIFSDKSINCGLEIVK